MSTRTQTSSICIEYILAVDLFAYALSVLRNLESQFSLPSTLLVEHLLGNLAYITR